MTSPAGPTSPHPARGSSRVLALPPPEDLRVEPGADLTTHRGFVDAIRSRPGGDADDAMPALDLALVVTALARSWPLANAELVAVEGDRDDPGRLARHRAWLVETVARLTGTDR